MRSHSESAARQRADYRVQKEKLRRLAETENLAEGQKECFKCRKTKTLNDFYLHPQMADGRLGKCKDCTRSDAAQRLSEKRNYVRQYDAWRQQTASRRKKKQEYHAHHNRQHPERAKARHMVSNAVRCGRLLRKPCEICNDPKLSKFLNQSFI